MKAGNQATLSCVISGKPTPNVIWRKDGRQIYEGRRYKPSVKSDGTATLVISIADAEDDGEYTVEAINDYGKDRKAVNLTVLCELTIFLNEIMEYRTN